MKKYVKLDIMRLLGHFSCRCRSPVKQTQMNRGLSRKRKTDFPAFSAIFAVNVYL
jgi:hypothetical protein